MNPAPPTHGELVLRAEMWLREKKCTPVYRELWTAKCEERPDAIGWKESGTSILIECKTSMSDFYADKKKDVRQNPEKGIGRRRYFMFPPGVYDWDEGKLNGWGLLICNPKTITVRKKSGLHPANLKAELSILSWFAKDEGLWQEYKEWLEAKANV